MINRAQWATFVARLEGPEGCHFRKECAKTTWDCKGGQDKSLATAILTKMGMPAAEVIDVLVFCQNHGGHCDCEILFNVVPKVEENPELIPE